MKEHYTVNHTLFYGSISNVHTNTIEGNWGVLKSKYNLDVKLKSWYAIFITFYVTKEQKKLLF